MPSPDLGDARRSAAGVSSLWRRDPAGAPTRRTPASVADSTTSLAKHAAAESSSVFKAAARPTVIGKAVYGTIVVTSVLVVYDGWANLKFSDKVAIILGPIIAMIIGHIFAGSLSSQAELGRRPTKGELLRTVGRELWFILVAAPQILLLLVLSLVGVSTSDAVQVLIWEGALSLGFWGGLAAQQAGLGGWGIALGVVMGFAIGAAVLVLRVILQPEETHPTSGAAAISPLVRVGRLTKPGFV
jgi:hypothetical protein